MLLLYCTSLKSLYPYFWEILYGHVYVCIYSHASINTRYVKKTICVIDRVQWKVYGNMSFWIYLDFLKMFRVTSLSQIKPIAYILAMNIYESNLYSLFFILLFFYDYSFTYWNMYTDTSEFHQKQNWLSYWEVESERSLLRCQDKKKILTCKLLLSFKSHIKVIGNFLFLLKM